MLTSAAARIVPMQTRRATSRAGRKPSAEAFFFRYFEAAPIDCSNIAAPTTAARIRPAPSKRKAVARRSPATTSTFQTEAASP